MASPDPNNGARGVMRLPYDFAVGGVLLLLVGLSVAQAFEPPPVEVQSVSPGVVEARNALPPEITLEALTCFTCHSLREFAEGGGDAFPHELHFDMLDIEGCHACHAFTGHTPIVNELEECADCH